VRPRDVLPEWFPPTNIFAFRPNVPSYFFVTQYLVPMKILRIISLFLVACFMVMFVHACSPFETKSLPLRVGITNWAGFDVAMYAQQVGLFKKRGLDVQFTRFQNSQDGARAVMKGSLDAAFTSLWSTMQVPPGQENPSILLVADISYGGDGIVAKSGIKSVAELKDKRIGAKLGVVNHLTLLEALKKYQMSPVGLDIKDLTNDVGIQWLKQGKLDAVVLWEPLLTKTAKDIGGKVIYTTKEVDSLVIDVLMSRSGLVEEKQEEFKRFILAWFDLMQAVETQPQIVFDIAATQLKQDSKSFASDYNGVKKGDRTLNQQMFQPNGRLQQAIPKTIQLIQEDRQRGKIVREAVDIHTTSMMAALKEWK
jgi:NitT/TauT family transport system substrate-binding protein